ncbi:mCG145450, partial [Mus musculus]
RGHTLEEKGDNEVFCLLICLCLVPTEARRGHQELKTVVTHHVLYDKPRLSGRAASECS